MCTVAAIDSDMGWYYLSCKVCAKKVLHVPNDTIDDEDDENSIMFSYYCPKCKVSNPKLLPRYKLHLIVVDSSGKSKFLLFDNLALEEPADIPLALKNLVGKTYLFKVGIERENFLYNHDTYKVTKIITNDEIISEFDTKVYPKVSI
ncbi:unnamed protein product [Brassica napus]|uniref:Replication factor A C-terminal domain-containing protein n=2 Tax=Brassica TaxID=3705 RepID=A0A3P5ZWZ1_BRACM|nr:unnamed protein product [Brassica napus]VDC84457.1 unnamed protein product [Brassica rapa]